jgi:tRNA A22 N-methylase
MQEASLQGVLKVIFIIILIYYGLKIITRLFGPLLLKYVTKKAKEKFKQQFDQYQQPQQSTEGEVTIENKTKQNSSNKDVGEYIDFEEID